MTRNASILALIEPDLEPQAVVERAVWLAKLYDAPLELVLCDSDTGPLYAGWYVSSEAKDLGEKILAAQQELIDELAAGVDTSGVELTTSVLEARPVAEAALELTHERQPALVVKGTHYHSAAERAIFVDTDWQLVRECPCPLYLAKPTALEERPKIVAAVDPTHAHDKPASLDRVIVETALDFGRRTDGEVHLLHTYQRVAGVGREATRTFKPIKLPLDEIDERIKKEHREALNALAADFDIGAENVHQLPGKPRELLPTFARTHGAGLVVMGALARWSLKRAVIGSTVERVLDHLPCDVLIVRAPLGED